MSISSIINVSNILKRPNRKFKAKPIVDATIPQWTERYEQEYRLFLQSPTSMKFNDFKSVMAHNGFDTNLQQYIEYTSKLEDGGTLRIRFTSDGIYWDAKKRMNHKLVSFMNLLFDDVTSAETQPKRLCESNDEARALCREALARAENYTTAVNRFTHPREPNLTMTWRESSHSDVGSIVLEYEYESILDIDKSHMYDYVSLFKHWCFKRTINKAPVFDHSTRPKVYTMQPTFAQDEAHECIYVHEEIIQETFAWKLCEFIEKENNMWALKWDGNQHLITFESIDDDRMTMHILASNNERGYVFNVSNMRKWLNSVYIVSEILLAQNRVIIVDICIPEYTLIEKIVLLKTTFNKEALRALQHTTGFQFELQKWHKQLKHVSTKHTDGLLLYEASEDRIYKIKPLQTVDLYCDKIGNLHTEDNVVVGKCKQHMNTISEYHIVFSESPQFRLNFIRNREDRITANTYLEFCEAAKSSIVSEAVVNFIESLTSKNDTVD